jgi:hypothetical protein
MIADNKLTENSQWNDRLLAEQLRELSLADIDFEIETTGFEIAEIDLRIGSLSVQDNDESDPADELPISLAGPAVKLPGPARGAA